MIPNDPIATLRFLTSFQPWKIHRHTGFILFFAAIIGTATLLTTTPGSTPIDVAALVLGLAFIGWIGERIVFAMLRMREHRKISQNRHLNDRLYIQDRCRQLLGSANQYSAHSYDDSYEVTITRTRERNSYSYFIDVVSRELCGLEGGSKPLFRFRSHGYIIDPSVCAMTIGYTVEVRRLDEPAGEQANIGIETSRLQGYLEVEDISRIREALDSDLFVVNQHQGGTEP